MAPPGNTPLPPLPGSGGVVHNAAATSNPWEAAGVNNASPVPPYAGLPRGPFPGPPTQQPLVDRAPIAVLALSALVVLALIAGAAFVVLKGGRTFPSAWDPRIKPIADWVERDRNLTFDHPVRVNFLSASEYSKEASGEDKELTDEAAKADQDSVAQLRALGFISGKLDLTKAQRTLVDSGSLAFYSPETKEVYVRGTKMTPTLRVTLAHELTHVLQDQAFDLGRIEALKERGQVMRALAEGDAERVEEAYAADVLSDADRKSYEAERNKASDDATKKLEEKVPPILTTVFAAPYILGPGLVAYLEQDGGDKAINGALQDPPTEEALFDPLTYRSDAAKPVKVELDAPKGAEEIDAGEFGPTTWYLMLATRMDPRVALRATDGWGGDHYVVYRKDREVCVDINARFDTADDTTQFTKALGEWVSQSPKGTASIDERGGVVSFTSCDPGEDAKATGTKPSADLLAVPATRTQVYQQIIKSKATEEQAACFARAVVDRFTPAQLTDDAYVNSPAGQQTLVAIRGDCL